MEKTDETFKNMINRFIKERGRRKMKAEDERGEKRGETVYVKRGRRLWELLEEDSSLLIKVKIHPAAEGPAGRVASGAAVWGEQP